MATYDFLLGAARLRFDGVDGLLDGDGDGVADATRVAALQEEAGSILETLLASAFPDPEQRVRMVELDPRLRGLAADLFVGLAGRTKSAFLGADGVGPYVKMQEKAEATLREYAEAKLRSTAEPTTGANPILSSSSTRHPDAGFVFVSTRRRAAGGGF